MQEETSSQPIEEKASSQQVEEKASRGPIVNTCSKRIAWDATSQPVEDMGGSEHGEEKASRDPVEFTSDEPIEVETHPWYTPEQFYPVKIGEVFESTFKVVAKLGYGAHSTVWLCRNISDDWLQTQTFVAIKVCTRDSPKYARGHQELAFYNHLRSIDPDHFGWGYVRGVLANFEVAGPTGPHLCLVHPPMHMTIREFMHLGQNKRLSKDMVVWALHSVLSALSLLHEAGTIHTDIYPSNVMLTLRDESILSAVEKAETEDPQPRKIVDGRTIYRSHTLGLPKNGLWGHPVLCDFGEARIGKCHKGLIQPEQYRSPEVLFQMEWDSSVDIWSVACLTWDLFTRKHLFNGLKNNKYDANHHAAEMVAYLGLPSLEFLNRSEIADYLFDEEGQWLADNTKIPEISLEEQDTDTPLEVEDRRLFLEFMRSMLKWLPEKRKTATELLDDPWLNTVDFIRTRMEGRRAQLQEKSKAKELNGKELNGKDLNGEEPNAKALNAEELNAEDLKAKELDAKEINAKELNTEELNVKELNIEEPNSEETNAKRSKSRELNAEELNAKWLDAKELDDKEFNAKELQRDQRLLATLAS